MKVLWFSNSSANADEFLNIELKGTGGWLKTLNKELQNYVTLSVAFFSSQNKTFKHENTTYYPIKRRNNVFDNFFNKCFNYHRKITYVEEYRQIVYAIGPDIIHIHGTENTFCDILNVTNIPIVISVQGNINVYRHKYFSGIEKEYLKNIPPRGNILKSLLYKNDFKVKYSLFDLQSEKERTYFSRCKNFIGRTDWDRRISDILSPKRRYFHCDEILRESFYLNKWIPRENLNTIIHTTTSNSLYKGFETICYTLNLLNKNGCNIEWRVAGLVDADSIVKVVKRKLGKGYPKKGLVFLGNLNASELINKMLEADLYVMPSHIENSPNSLCEAMILGMPCISTFAGGTNSLLYDKKEGILIQDGDPWSMAGAVLELLEDYESAIIYGKRARERALVRHNKNKIVKELTQIYNEIIDLK